MKTIALTLLFASCSAANGSQFELRSGGFEGERDPKLGGTVMAWNDHMTFNNGYQERDEPAFEAVASESIFDAEVDLLSLDGQSFLNAVHTFRFGDGMHLRINETDTLRQGDELQLNSDEGNARWQLAFKLGAESLGGSAELDDPRRGFRLPGRLTASLRITELSRDDAGSIAAMNAELELKIERCPPSEHNRGEGEAYRPGAFKAQLSFAPVSERLAEHNLKLLLGLSPLPLPDNNGFEFPGFTRNCRNNPRPPID
jgi:hypothetical protein